MITGPPTFSATSLVACVLLCTGAESVARPREPPAKWKDLSGPTAESDAWLRRLAGRFRYEGSLQRQEPASFVSVKGLGDCINVGAGPGVQCIFNLEWPPPFGLSMEPVAVANLNPAMILYGLDPGIAGLQYLQVNQKGLAEGGGGSIKGDTATFRAPCVNTGSNSLAGIPSPVANPGGRPPSSRNNAALPGPGRESVSPEGDFGSDSGSDSGSDPGSDFGSGFDSGGGSAGQSDFGGSLPDMSTGFAAGADLFGACMRVTRIEARPDSRIIWVRIDIGDPMWPTYSFVLSMYRIPQPGAAAEAIAAP